MKIQELIKHYGSQANIAREFGYTRQAVSYWFRIGAIPFRTQLMIQAATLGKFKARKEKVK